MCPDNQNIVNISPVEVGFQCAREQEAGLKSVDKDVCIVRGNFGSHCVTIDLKKKHFNETQNY